MTFLLATVITAVIAAWLSIIFEWLMRKYIKLRGRIPIRHDEIDIVTKPSTIIIIPCIVGFVYNIIIQMGTFITNAEPEIFMLEGQSHGVLVADLVGLLIILGIEFAMAINNALMVFSIYRFEKSGKADLEAIDRMK